MRTGRPHLSEGARQFLAYGRAIVIALLFVVAFKLRDYRESCLDQCLGFLDGRQIISQEVIHVGSGASQGTYMQIVLKANFAEVLAALDKHATQAPAWSRGMDSRTGLAAPVGLFHWLGTLRFGFVGSG